MWSICESNARNFMFSWDASKAFTYALFFSAIDVAVFEGVYDGNGSIVRGYPASHSFSATIKHVSGSYPIVQMTDTHMQNYKVYYLISNKSLSNSTEAFVSGDPAVADVSLMASQEQLNIGEAKRLIIRTPFRLDRLQCDFMAYLCFLILHHENGSYVEQNVGDNIICINVTFFKICNPGRDSLLGTEI